jgi:hypothetical protein
MTTHSISSDVLSKVASFLTWPAWCRAAQIGDAAARRARELHATVVLDRVGVPLWIRLGVGEELLATSARRVELDGKTFTGYIDFVDSYDFPSGSALIYGRDFYGRFFLSCRFAWEGEDEARVVTLFQRYSDDDGIFVDAGQHLSPCWFVSRTDVVGFGEVDAGIARKLAPEHMTLFELIRAGRVSVPGKLVDETIQCRLLRRTTVD